MNNAIVLSRKLYSRALKITIYFACAAGGPARTAPKGHVPLESPFPPAGGIWYGCCLRCAVPAPPERRRGGWLSSAELFDREYNGLSEVVPSVSKVRIEFIFTLSIAALLCPSRAAIFFWFSTLWRMASHVFRHNNPYLKKG